MTGRHLLKLGAFVCADGNGDVDTGRGYKVHTIGQDFTLGNPQPIEVTVGSLLKDGTIKAHSRYENRDDTYFAVTLTGDSIGLAQGEADLLAEMDRRNELTWRTYDGRSTVVLDVLVASLVPMPDDFREAHHNQATYGVRLSCLPWVRTAEPEVLTSTVTVAPTRTTVNACDSTAGWTFTDTGTVVTLDARTCIRVDATLVSNHSGQSSGWLVASLPVASPRAFLSVDVKPQNFNDAQYLSFVSTPPGGGANMTLTVEATEARDFGWTRYYLDTSGMVNNTVVTIRAVASRSDPVNTASMWVDDIASLTTLGAPSAKESLRSLLTRGSRSAPCSVLIEAATGQTLGQTLVLSTPDLAIGYAPNLRQYRTDGLAVATDPTRISGTVEDLATAFGTTTFTAALSTQMLRPGAYELIAYANAASLTAQICYGPVNSVPNVEVSATPATGWRFTSLGIVHLPHIPVPPESRRDVMVRLIGSRPSADALLDELFLVPRDDDSALTIVSAGRVLWLDAPSLTQPRGGVWTGTAPDKSDAISAWQDTQAKGQHLTSRGRTLLFVATSAPTSLPTVTLTHYPSGHTRVPSQVS